MTSSTVIHTSLRILSQTDLFTSHTKYVIQHLKDHRNNSDQTNVTHHDKHDLYACNLSTELMEMIFIKTKVGSCRIPIPFVQSHVIIAGFNTKKWILEVSKIERKKCNFEIRKHFLWSIGQVLKEQAVKMYV